MVKYPIFIQWNCIRWMHMKWSKLHKNLHRWTCPLTVELINIFDFHNHLQDHRIWPYIMNVFPIGCYSVQFPNFNESVKMDFFSKECLLGTIHLVVVLDFSVLLMCGFDISNSLLRITGLKVTSPVHFQEMLRSKIKWGISLPATFCCSELVMGHQCDRIELWKIQSVYVFCKMKQDRWESTQACYQNYTYFITKCLWIDCFSMEGQ